MDTVPAPTEALRVAMTDAAVDIDRALDMLIPPSEGAEARLFDAMRYAAMGGGKRLRGFLVLECARQFSVGRDTALRTAAAIEMLHAYSLVHDDLPCMDDDDLRRGRPTCHVEYDEATALLVGDSLQTLAFELLARDALQAHAFHVLAEPDTHADPAVRIELCRNLARASGPRGMCGGQMMDMLAEAIDEPMEEAEIGRLQMLKTGKLIEFSAEAGAILGKAPLQMRHALAAYGRDLGAAFQIADDLLDATASREEVGKSTGKDQAAGKATLVGLLGLPRARAQMERLAAQAAAHLDVLGDRADLLRALAHYAIARRN